MNVDETYPDDPAGDDHAGGTVVVPGPDAFPESDAFPGAGAFPGGAAFPGAGAFPGPDVFSPHCPSRDLLEHVVSRWSTLTLVALADGPFRFGVLRRRVAGISERMLSQTLQLLERDGLVLRTVLSAFPPRVEYSLTPAGQRIAAPLREVIDVVQHELPQALAAQAAFDARGGRLPV